MKTIKQQLLFLILFCFHGVTLYSQDTQLTATAPKKVELGSLFSISYTVNASVSDIQIGNMDGFNFYAGPSVSKSIENSFFNNRSYSSQKTTFTYTYRANKIGTFKIAPAYCTVSGKKIKSNELIIQVEKEVAGGNQAQQSSPRRGQNARPNATVPIDSKTIFIKAIPNKTQVQKGEEIIVTYKVYSLLSAKVEVIKAPTSKGFWIETLEEKQSQGKHFTEVIDGRTYYGSEILKVSIFPQESGKLKLLPIEIEAALEIETQEELSFFEDWFSDPFFANMLPKGVRTQIVRKTVSSNTIEIQVSDLPTAPVGFTGGVGEFTVKSGLDKTYLKAHEALTYSISISGRGNCMLIDKPLLSLPPSFEIYEPTITTELTKSTNGISGTKKFEWILIPRSEGTYELPSYKFVYFDPKIKRYRDLLSENFTLHIAKGDPNLNFTLPESTENTKTEAKKDIQYIKTNTIALQTKSSSFFRSSLYYVLVLSALFLYPLLVITSKKLIIRYKNSSFTKTKKTIKRTKQKIKQLGELTEKNKGEFYEKLASTLREYISFKLGIPTSSFSIESIEELSVEKNFKTEEVQKLTHIIQQCEFARFAPETHQEEDKKTLLELTVKTIQEIEKLHKN